MSLLVFISSLIILVSSQTSRFIMDIDTQFNILQPFPIDVCFQSSTFPTTYALYECNFAGTEVYKKEWNASSLNLCNTNTDGTITSTFNTNPSCGQGSFHCGGASNYLFQNLYQNNPTCTQDPIITLPIATGCFCDTNNSSIQISCTDAYTGKFMKYDTDSTCSSSSSMTSDIGACGLYNSVSFGGGFTREVYADIESCTINGVTIDKTPGPTMATAAPIPTPAPIPFTTRFVIDDDWFYGEKVSFPIDKCLQTQPLSAVYGLTPEFVYYECNNDGDQVTKYKWTTNDTAFDVLTGFDCMNKTTAQQTVINLDMVEGEICSDFYFNCNGYDDYMTLSISGSTTTNDCADTNQIFDLFEISIVTEACICQSASTSNIYSCDGSKGSVVSKSGSINCGISIINGSLSSSSNPFAEANECIPWKVVSNIPIDNVTEISMTTFTDLEECITNDVNLLSKEPTKSPSKAPSEAPTKFGDTKKPSNSPTAEPSISPSDYTSDPSIAPSMNPSVSPSESPTDITGHPTYDPSISPSYEPSISPTEGTDAPSNRPSMSPSTAQPTGTPFIYTREPTEAEGCNQIMTKMGIILSLFVVMCVIN